MSEVLTIGEAMAVFASTDLDVSLADASDFKKYLAGAEVNVAVGVSRLNHSVQYVTRVGSDPIGQFIQTELKDNRIATDHVQVTDEYMTGLMFKQKVSHGDPAVANYRKNSAASHYSATFIDNVDLSDVKIAHITGVFPALSPETLQATQKLFDRCSENKKLLKIFDTNLRPALWDSQDQMVKAINHFANQAHVVLPGVNEGAILVGSRDPETIADYYLGSSEVTHTVIVKVGADGAYIKTKSGVNEFVAGFKVDRVVDTVGAGDGFALGVITGLLEQLSIKEAVRRGNAIGAMAVQAAGDNDGYPTSKQLEHFLQAN
ncbi:sugar kinase [Weissella muntiaci]|uniref:Sugar kinase n=1 Tax=Weissella muntiaci TaxID=2508881 RepID=A0A6C2C505_9LACO|nr:sugar kinase [Weissella muntiaci]TYC49081.1 sugar kinase [Weissella muntiaci]